jgi:hypothetical protein
LIQQYQYQRINQISDDLTKPDELEVVIKFDEVNLNRQLASIQLPVWSKLRPDVLVWLAIKSSSEEEILSDGSQSAIKMVLTQSALDRGLPIVLPTMDLNDQRMVSISDVWNREANLLALASERYAAQVILNTQVTVLSNGHLLVNWHTIINGVIDSWESRGELSYAIQSGVDELTDRLARRFTQVVSPNQNAHIYELSISDVLSYHDYAKVMQYLNSLQYVTSVNVNHVSGSELRLSVGIEGDMAVFDRTIAISQILAKSTSEDVEQKFAYQLVH